MATLTAGISSSATILPVSGPVDIGHYTLDAEAIYVHGTSRGEQGRDFDRNKVTVDRAIAGTTATTHLSGVEFVRYYPDAATAASEGGGVAVLEDPGNVFTPATVVVQGHRVAETIEGELRVFESTVAGTTHPTATGIADFQYDLTPLAITNGGDVDWRYLGIVGELPWDVMPITQGLPANWTIDGETGGWTFASAISADEFESVIEVTVPEGAIWSLTTAGSFEHSFRSAGAGVSYRVNHDALSYEVFGISNDEVHIDGPGGEIFVVYPGLHVIAFQGLPTADPVFAGQLWVDVAAGRVLKVSAG